MNRSTSPSLFGLPSFAWKLILAAAILAAGGTPAEAAVVANFAAGIEVGKLGAATVTPAEVLNAWDDYQNE